MIKDYVFLVLLVVSGLSCAKDKCGDIRGEQRYPPLNIKGGAVCFVQEPVLDSKTETPVGADSISLYYIANGSVPVKAEGRGLLYDDAPSQIADAFSLKVGRDRVEKVFVINFVEVRESLVEKNSSGKFYSVDVFDLAENALRRDDRASDWFGSDYSFLSDGSKIIYKFPYQSRKDVQRAMDSPFALLMIGDGGIPVRVKYKAYLFGGPDIRSRTGKYLVADDGAVVEKITAGWCQVGYSGGARPLKMWLMCGALDVEENARVVN
ncbi:conserved protein of unknown function [Burkholderia multivorans]